MLSNLKGIKSNFFNKKKNKNLIALNVKKLKNEIVKNQILMVKNKNAKKLNDKNQNLFAKTKKKKNEIAKN